MWAESWNVTPRPAGLGGSNGAAQDRLPDQCPPPPATSAIFASASWDGEARRLLTRGKFLEGLRELARDQLRCIDDVLA
jgi:hypothetical protein